jgi:hypothetical protein
MNAHELAQILLQGENCPVVMQSFIKPNEANPIQDIGLYQNTDSPFEYCLLLSSKETQFLTDEIEMPD